MKKLLLLSVHLLSATSCKTFDSHPAPQSVVGAWEYAAWEDHAADGKISRVFGEGPKGMAIFDAKGYLSVQVTKEHTATPQEAVENYFAYFGRYELDFKSHIATFTVERGLGVSPGQVFKVPFKLEGETLTLTPHMKGDDGKEMSGIRRLRRLH